MSKIEEFEKKLGSLSLELEVMKAEAAQDEGWPKLGGDVYTVAENGLILKYKLFNTLYDKHRIATGNVHRTEEEAAAYREWLTNPRTQARRRVEGCDGFDLAGSRGIVSENGELTIFSYRTVNNCGLRFTTERQACACIDLLGEDVINLAIGVES